MEEHAPGMAPTTFFAAVEQGLLLEIALLNVTCGFGRTNRHIDNANCDDFDPLAKVFSQKYIRTDSNYATIRKKSVTIHNINKHVNM